MKNKLIKASVICIITAGLAFLIFRESTPFKKTDLTEEICPGKQLPYPRPEPEYNGKIKRDFTPFAEALERFNAKASSVAESVNGKNIPELQQLMKQGKLSSEELVLHYLHRMQQYDIDKLNAVLELNPDALTIARAKDSERKAGKGSGQMHGIPVLIKGNIATDDKMHTTAGAAAMLDWKPTRDAFLVAQLRKAGAIILGKANLSEWANYMDPCMPSGFSAVGGQTRNPYGPFDTWGSSSGSAVSVAAELVTVSVGSETQGSIIMPAGINSVVGLKTSMGLVSRDHIIPLLAFQDVPGPMARTVTDLAILLSAMTGNDENDKATKNAMTLAGADFTSYLHDASRKKFRVGIPMFDTTELIKGIKELEGKNDTISFETRKQLQLLLDNNVKDKIAFEKSGIGVVSIPIELMPMGLPVDELLEYGFKDDLNSFFAKLGNNAPHTNLASIITYNQADLKNRAPYGQKYLENAQHSRITKRHYDSICSYNQTRARFVIDSLLKHYGVDAILHDMAQSYAPAGYPALTLPTGYDENGEPKNSVLVGTYLSEPTLLAIGFALEQTIKARKAPDLDKTIKSISEIKQTKY